MPKRDNSDEEENVASNASSDQNESDSDQEVAKHSSKRKAQIDSDSNESENKLEESSDESSDDEKEDLKRKELKKVLSESDDEEKSGKSDKSDKNSDDGSDGEKSNKSNQKSDDNKSDKSDAEKSDDEIFSPKKKARKVMESDSESGQDSDFERKRIKQERSNDDIEDIFGKMSDEEEEEDSKRVLAAKQENKREDSDREEQEASSQQQEEERVRDIFQQFEEDEEEQAPETETRIDITIPKINVDLGKESHFVKLPNFLSVDTHPYDPSWYEDEIDEDEICDDEGRARMKLKVENTIRWRNVVDKDGQITKESNARIVKWSDGSMSLHLGAEIFDIHKQQLLSGDNNHLYIRQGTGLQGQTVFKTKLTFRPHSTDSFTHKKMTLSLADRSQKTQKIRVLPTVGLDPEANRTDRIKKEEDKLRASLRRENKARRVRERVNVRGPTTSYLEPDVEDDDEGAISLSAIKNKYKQRGSNFADVYSDSESSKSSADSIFNKKKASATKKTGRIEESDDE